MKKNIIIMLIVGSFHSACNSSNLLNHSQTPNENDASALRLKPIKMVNARNARYCEIIIVSGGVTNMIATVYNTLGCNECPETVWKKIDQEKLKNDFNAKAIIMNGPRVFLMDSIGQYNMPSSKINLGGVEMIERAKLTIDFKTFLKGKRKAYDEIEINRATEFVFKQGGEAYFLHHNGDAYIMQSFAQIVNPNLKEEGLNTLTSSLNLPEGWTYEAKKLDKTIVLKTNQDGKAYIIQDDFQNTYQKIK
jgi:hypothetical protein